VNTVLDQGTSADFLRDFQEFHAKIVPFGILNSLAQTLIKMTAPGVPDFYQGTELWDLSLVDPDNRRPVDFGRRRQMLKMLTTEIDAATDLSGLARRLMNDPADGAVKLYVIRQALAVRRRRADLFVRGEYRAVEVRGSHAEHIFAFARTGPGGPTLTVIPLLAARGVTDPVGAEYWGNTALVIPPEIDVPLGNAFTGARVEAEGEGEHRRLPVGTVLAAFPVALLEAA
jgi:(1->4)-alpha-D-glucan 1-alpha-D-glucosylmutase